MKLILLLCGILIICIDVALGVGVYMANAMSARGLFVFWAANITYVVFGLILPLTATILGLRPEHGISKKMAFKLIVLSPVIAISANLFILFIIEGLRNIFSWL